MRAPTDLEQSMYQTVLWFSLFQTPITAFEMWKWMIAPEGRYQLVQVYSALQSSPWLRTRIHQELGFYAPISADVTAWVEQRQVRFVDAERKFARLRRVARYFSLLPAVRAVGVGNSLAWWATSPTSDIDLYIVTRPGHVWSTRFWLVLPFLLTGQRPTQEEGRGAVDPFCLSFFTTQDRLQLQDLCIDRDYYMAFWVRSLVPVVDRDGCFERFHEENRWAQSMLPHAHVRSSHTYHAPRSLPSLPVQWGLTESWLRTVQLNRFPQRLRSMANVDSRVVVSDDMLKFHVNDRRLQFRDQFEALCETHSS